MKINLKDKLSHRFSKLVIFPMFLAGILFILFLILFNSYMFLEVKSFEISKAKNVLKTLLENEQKILTDKFSTIEVLATVLQKEHEQIFKYKDIRDKKVDFLVAKNGVYYKTTKKGSSVYYSSTTKIGEQEKNKVLFTQNMDRSFETIVNNNDLIVAAYFNSYDNMNRLYPYIPKVYEQYGSTLLMQDYNFYYLADKKHNPSKKPVWTEAYLDPAGNGWMISCVVPIYSGDFLEGVTGIDITLETMIKKILDKQLPYDAKMMLISKNGTITAMSDNIFNLTGVKELKKHNYTEPIKNTIKKPKEFNIFKSKNKFLYNISQMISKKIDTKDIKINSCSYTILQNRLIDGSTLVLYAKKSMIIETISYMKNKFFMIILFLVVLTVLILYLQYKKSLKYYNELSTQIAKPITFLSKITKDISTQTNFIVPKVNILEIDELSENFINMIKELHSKTTQLEDINNSLAISIEDATKELKEKNKLTNTLLNTTMEAVVIFDEEYKIMQANQAARDMFQFSNEDNFFSYHLFDFVPKDELLLVQKILSKEMVIPYELNLYRKDKIIFPALAKGSNIIIDNKQYRISTIIDLTEIKQKDQQILEQSRLAQMGEMISMIAHQWRQPLNSISAASISILLKSKMGSLDKETAIQLSSNISNYTQHLSSTINDFRDFFKETKVINKISYEQLIDSTLNIIEDSIANHNIKIVKEIHDNTKYGIYSNEVKQVLLNILKNAEDALIDNDIQNGQIKIKSDDGALIISDNGGGVPEDIIDKIFNPYFSTKSKNGTGLGLYMSKMIIEEHCNGSLTVSNDKDGAVFKIVLGDIKNNENNKFNL